MDETVTAFLDYYLDDQPGPPRRPARPGRSLRAGDLRQSRRSAVTRSASGSAGQPRQVLHRGAPVRRNPRSEPPRACQQGRLAAKHSPKFAPTLAELACLVPSWLGG
jgi:hypothetical protein